MCLVWGDIETPRSVVVGGPSTVSLTDTPSTNLYRRTHSTLCLGFGNLKGCLGSHSTLSTNYHGVRDIPNFQSPLSFSVLLIFLNPRLYSSTSYRTHGSLVTQRFTVSSVYDHWSWRRDTSSTVIPSGWVLTRRRVPIPPSIFRVWRIQIWILQLLMAPKRR